MIIIIIILLPDISYGSAWVKYLSDWKIEGITGWLTRYRIQSGGLSANLSVQFETWKKMCRKVRDTSPDFAAEHAAAAESYQLRFLARRAFMMRDGKLAAQLSRKAITLSRVPLREEFLKTLTTVLACELLRMFGTRNTTRKFFDLAKEKSN